MDSMSVPMKKLRVIRIAVPRIPLVPMARTIPQGTAVAAFTLRTETNKREVREGRAGFLDLHFFADMYTGIE
jgi:hypothetical protein